MDPGTLAVEKFLTPEQADDLCEIPHTYAVTGPQGSSIHRRNNGQILSMALQSKLFRGDPKLEAAAVSDPAHIVPGSAGPHVGKIQTALVILDGAGVAADELHREAYGPCTADAVLAYKRKRSIINRSYQTQADNIVGKMTMASLDAEMLKKEVSPPSCVVIKPVSYWRHCAARPQDVRNLSSASRSFGLNIDARSGTVGDGPPHIFPGGVALEIPEGGIGVFSVINGVGGTVGSRDPFIGVVFDPAEPQAHGGTLRINRDPQLFNVRGRLPGRTTIEAVNPHASQFFLGQRAFLDVVVQNPRQPTQYTEGPKHDHKPCRRWEFIQNNPNNAPGPIGDLLAIECRNSPTPGHLMDEFVRTALSGLRHALQHINWFLRDGQGRDFVEDANIEHWLRTDEGIRNKLRDRIFGREHFRPPRPISRGHFDFSQEEFDDDDDDFRFSFGSIDWVDFEVDFGDESIHVWFKDRYEWHPFYPNLYPQMSGDEQRQSNCIHAAGVELKAADARDFWMKGEAFVPLSLILNE